jgi:hypoxanthine phosphoribosyltransferase
VAVSKERAYQKAVARVAVALNSSMPLNEMLDIIIRSTARAMKSGASLVMLDATRTKLIHSSSWGLSQAYRRKGILDADKSLAAVMSGQTVIINDARQDTRVQYPELADRAGIISILGMPLKVSDDVVGSLRIYTKDYREFSSRDLQFVSTMTNLTATAIQLNLLPPESGVTSPAAPHAEMLQQASQVAFAHPSEEEFANILDFYHIEWVYEPRSFPLSWEGDRVTEMFTPDFYLPGLDLYVELTTMKQSLVTEKNRKLRFLREQYPDIKITLLYKKDFDRLLAKYGCGPLAEVRGRSVRQVLFSSTKIHRRIRQLAERISTDYADRNPVMIGVLRGVFCFMADLVRQMSIPLEVEFMAVSYYSGEERAAVRITKDIDVDISGRHVIMVEDIVDTGMTLNYLLSYLRAKGPATLAVCTLLDKRVRRIVEVPFDYTGFEVADEFVVGYGLDYHGEYRNLPFVGVLGPSKAPASISEEKA